MMNNFQFNINGKTKEQLRNAVNCLLLDEYGCTKKVSGYYFKPHCGLVLVSYCHDGVNKFTNRMGIEKPVDVDELTSILWEWLDSDDAHTSLRANKTWDADFNDSDVSTELGWRLYCDEWGHVKESNGHTIDHSSIAAFKPVYLWYGK